MSLYLKLDLIVSFFFFLYAICLPENKFRKLDLAKFILSVVYGIGWPFFSSYWIYEKLKNKRLYNE